MALPTVITLFHTRGDTCPIIFSVSDPNGVPITPANTAIMTVDTLQNPPDASTEVFSMNAVVTTGILTFTPLVGDVDLLGKFFYDVQLTDPLNNICTIVKATIQFRQDITK